MGLLFDRDARELSEALHDLPPDVGADRRAQGATAPTSAGDDAASEPVSTLRIRMADLRSPADVRRDEEIERLTEEVAHLRACVGQLLDLLDEQDEVEEDLGLLEDRMAVVERRVERTERDVSQINRATRKRGPDQR